MNSAQSRNLRTRRAGGQYTQRTGHRDADDWRDWKTGARRSGRLTLEASLRLPCSAAGSKLPVSFFTAASSTAVCTLGSSCYFVSTYFLEEPTSFALS